MEGSGLEEAASTIYSPKSLPKIFSGKSYTRGIRLAMLLESSILNTLWKTANMSEDVLDLMKDVTEVIDLLLDKKTTLDQARDSTAIKSLSSIMDELKEEQMHIFGKYIFWCCG